MKKFMVALMLCFISNGTFAQFSVGEYVQLVKGLAGWYQGKIALAVTNIDGVEVPSMCLYMNNSVDYDIYDEESRILVKFDDDTKMTLHRLKGDQTLKEYDNQVISGVLYHHYQTYTQYYVEMDFLNKLLTNGIVKVRVVMANGNAKDYEIKGGYQKELSSKLKDSYVTARKENKQREKNMNDDDF